MFHALFSFNDTMDQLQLRNPAFYKRNVAPSVTRSSESTEVELNTDWYEVIYFTTNSF